mmetsp:Transcript_965/g.2085  ORF Transcript_965/g.2085 Transcript_965/m.2085 type:complete len:103 (+) Transcript_965:172-480(+)
MTGKDKTAKSNKSKKALEAEFLAALQAADQGDSFTCKSSNTAKGGTSISVSDMEHMKYNQSGSGEIVRPTVVQTEKVSKKELREAKKKAKQEQKEARAGSTS